MPSRYHGHHPVFEQESRFELGVGIDLSADPVPPANILTPAALTLRLAPVADCARYDNLRRTV
jgi:hypothetical protein